MTILQAVHELRAYEPQRVNRGELYYYITEESDIDCYIESNSEEDDKMFECKNYFKSEIIAEEHLNYIKKVLGRTD